jgi:hypothetical protein
MELSKKCANSLFSRSTSCGKARNRKFENDYITLALMADLSVQLGSSDCSGFLCYQGHVSSEMLGIPKAAGLIFGGDY